MPIRYDVSVINPFLAAAVDVLATMAQVVARPGKPYVNRKRTAQGDVTGLIGIAGDTVGTVSLTLSAGAILKIVNNMLAESYTEINADIADAVGELTNMITGQARKHLAENGMVFQAGTPSVIIGQGHRVNHIGTAPVLAIPFETDDGTFVIEVSFADASVLKQPAE
jgi:chemotaxis protein CheX